jgi:neutral ceramidase
VLEAGVASRDITPALRGDFFGYVRPDLRARGVALRLHAHALVLDDGRRKVGLLTLDLGAPLVTDAVLERLTPAGFDRSNLLVAATHTHAGPNRPGRWVAAQAADAVLAADRARRPARAGWADATVLDANHNRSLEAHLANHRLDLYPGTGHVELDPDGADHPRDTTLRLLRVDSEDGRPLAAWAQFSAHPTTFGPANTCFSADFPRAAIHHFRAGSPGPAPATIVTNGTEGDLIPRYDEYNQHALADRIGQRVAAAMRRAWDAAEPGELTVDGVGTEVGYRGQEVEPGRPVGDRAWFGLPFLGGGENGPSFLFGLGLQGKRRPRVLAGAVQGRKLVVAPAPHPSRAEVTVLRVGDRLLLGVPGEPSVEAGRRMCAAALSSCRAPVGAAMIVGLVHRYLGYFTTPEEYDQQHYEGGHTVFGRHTSLLIERTHAELAAELTDAPRHWREPGPGRPGRAREGEILRGSDAVGAEPGGGTADEFGAPASRLRLVRQPPPEVARLTTVEIAWQGAPRGYDRPVGEPLLVLQRQTARGWEDVDDDLGLGFVWRQRGRQVTARYEVPVDLPIGRHRLQVRGRRAWVSTAPFAVVACHELRLRGVEVVGPELRFVAQVPPPNPVEHLRARERSPRGGSVRFEVGASAHRAEWDAGVGAWVAAVTPVPEQVHVPVGGLEDGVGNRSGVAVDLAVGRVARLDWPPPMGPGGGRSPGPFGLGPAGQVRPWPPTGR